MNEKEQVNREELIEEIPDEVGEKVLRAFSQEDNIRDNKNKVIMFVVSAVALACAAFHLYTSGFGLLESMKQRAIHLAFMMFLVFLLYPARKKDADKGPSVLDIIFAVAGSLASLMVVIFYKNFMMSFGISDRKFQIAFIVLTILILEATRRCVAKELSIIAAFFLLYAIFGNYFPGVFKVTSFSLQRLTDHLYMIPEGIFGTCLGTASNYIILFVIFGTFLEASGMGILIRDFAIALTGQAVGGPAKISIVSSAIFGSVSGSAAANVVTTGSFTIPLMKKTGYSPSFAAAVEAAASTGGQIVPPVMGTAAFLMADILGMDYGKILVAAILPALLYYISLFAMVHLRAKKIGLHGIPKEECPDLKKVLLERGHMFFPFLIVIAMICMRFSPIYAGFYGILSVVFFASLRKSTRMSPKTILNACISGVKKAVNVSIACACVGFVVGVSVLTGIGTILSNYMLILSGNNLQLLCLIVAAVSIFLGMGLPATGVYIVTVTVCVPALIQLGVPPLAAHMFPFYYGIYASITPPVCIGSYAAAGLAGCSPQDAGYAGFKIAIPGLLIPFIFIISPALLFANGTTLFQTAQTFCTALIGVISMACAVEGWFMAAASRVEMALFFFGGVSMALPGSLTDGIGLLCIAAAGTMQYLRYRRAKTDDRSDE